jgi:hypothetical protein
MSRTFFVALRAKTEQGKEGTYVALYRRDLARAGHTDIRYPGNATMATKFSELENNNISET